MFDFDDVEELHSNLTRDELADLVGAQRSFDAADLAEELDLL